MQHDYARTKQPPDPHRPARFGMAGIGDGFQFVDFGEHVLAAQQAGLADRLLGGHRIAQLEQCVDTLQKETPEPETFVLPGGCTAAAESHVCRTVARRAERSIVAMSHEYRVEPLILQFINRLSDYFFVLALNLNFITSIDEKKLYITCK